MGTDAEHQSAGHCRSIIALSYDLDDPGFMRCLPAEQTLALEVTRVADT